jgi:hypothetical protein
MDVRKVREWLRALVPGVALVVLATLSSVQVISAAEARKTFEDRFAEQDIRDAAQDIDRMHRILGAELQRLASGAGGSVSDEVLPLSGLHKILRGYAANVVQLKLPPFTQEKMLAEARAYALKQDADLASSYAHPRQVWQANVDFLTYLDEHAAHAHYANNQILFDDPAEAQATQDLLTRLKAVSQ